MPLKPAKRSGERCKPLPKTNFVHSNAVRKLLVAIILNILSTMFYSKNYQNLALANMSVSDGVSPSPKGGGRPSRLGPL